MLHFIEKSFSLDLPLIGRQALVTAGPTHEAIDPVRFIGNHSSGKMGYALAKQLSELGAQVTLISGPTALESPKNVHRISITSAQEMLEAVEQYFIQSDIIVMSAAVADYTPIEVATQKIKKKEDQFAISLKND